MCNCPVYATVVYTSVLVRVSRQNTTIVFHFCILFFELGGESGEKAVEPLDDEQLLSKTWSHFERAELSNNSDCFWHAMICSVASSLPNVRLEQERQDRDGESAHHSLHYGPQFRRRRTGGSPWRRNPRWYVDVTQSTNPSARSLWLFSLKRRFISLLLVGGNFIKKRRDEIVVNGIHHLIDIHQIIEKKVLYFLERRKKERKQSNLNGNVWWKLALVLALILLISLNSLAHIVCIS